MVIPLWHKGTEAQRHKGTKQSKTTGTFVPILTMLQRHKAEAA
jgi:hypothetical protein